MKRTIFILALMLSAIAAFAQPSTRISVTQIRPPSDTSKPYFIHADADTVTWQAVRGDTVTLLFQDSILVYFQLGIETGRDTIRLPGGVASIDSSIWATVWALGDTAAAIRADFPSGAGNIYTTDGAINEVRTVNINNGGTNALQFVIDSANVSGSYFTVWIYDPGFTTYHSRIQTTRSGSYIRSKENQINILDQGLDIQRLSGSTAPFKITDAGSVQTGIQYDAKYHAGYTNRSLVDKEFVVNYVDTAASGGGGDTLWLKTELEAGRVAQIAVTDTSKLIFTIPDDRANDPVLVYDFESRADELPYIFWQALSSQVTGGRYNFGFYDKYYSHVTDSVGLLFQYREGFLGLDYQSKLGYFQFKNYDNPARLRLESNHLSRHITITPPEEPTATWVLTLPVNAGSAGQALFTDGTGETYWDEASGGGGGDTSHLVFRYTTAQSNTTLAVPSGAKAVEIHAVGGGGGGGGGRRGASGTVRLGGGGGGGGGYSWGTYSIASDLGGASNLYFTVGAAGTAGARATTNDTHGTAGGDGGATFIGTSSGPGGVFLRAYGGTGGQGSSNGLAGASTAGSMMLGGTGGQSDDSAVRNSAASATTSGGGAGGVIKADNTFVSGGSAGQASTGAYSLLPGGDDPAWSGSTPTLIEAAKFGQGGSGGGARNEGNAPGGSGVRGGGGGGGNPSLNGNNSGQGGQGGAGYLLVVFHF